MGHVHVKKNDMVVVLAGRDIGKSGKVLSVDTEKNRVVVEGINIRKKTLRRSHDNPQGGLVDKECPIHASNVMLKERYDARRAAKGAAVSSGSGENQD